MDESLIPKERKGPVLEAGRSPGGSSATASGNVYTADPRQYPKLPQGTELAGGKGLGDCHFFGISGLFVSAFLSSSRSVEASLLGPFA